MKNLPANSSLNDLKSLFAKYGELGRTIMPPSGVSALIEFMNEQQAKTAFKALAYKKFVTTPLFFEWAPEDVFCAQPSSYKPSDKETEEKEDAIENVELPEKPDEASVSDGNKTIKKLISLNYFVLMHYTILEFSKLSWNFPLHANFL